MQSSITRHAGSLVRPGIDRPAQSIAAAARVPRDLRFEDGGVFGCDVTVDSEMCGPWRLECQAMFLISPTGRADGAFRAVHARGESEVNGEIDYPTGALDFADAAHCKVMLLSSEFGTRGADIGADLQRVTEKAHGHRRSAGRRPIGSQ